MERVKNRIYLVISVNSVDLDGSRNSKKGKPNNTRQNENEIENMTKLNKMSFCMPKHLFLLLPTVMRDRALRKLLGPQDHRVEI